MRRVPSCVKSALHGSSNKLIIVSFLAPSCCLPGLRWWPTLLLLLLEQIIKIGTSSLINEKYGTLNLSSLSRICEVVRELHAKGTSGLRLSSSGRCHCRPPWRACLG